MPLMSLYRTISCGVDGSPGLKPGEQFTAQCLVNCISSIISFPIDHFHPIISLRLHRRRSRVNLSDEEASTLLLVMDWAM